MTPSEPARPRRLHPLTPVLGVLDRQLLAPGIVALGVGAVRLLFVGVLVMLAVRTLQWWRRTWVFDGAVLKVESGVLSRSQQLVPSGRIQEVGVVQKFRQRLFGLATLRVEVAAGGEGAGVELDALALSEAEELREALLAAKASSVPVAVPGGPAGDVPAWVPAPWPVVELGYGDLAVAGLTGVRLLVVFAVAASTFELIDELPGSPPDVSGIDLGTAGIVLLALAFVVLWLGSAAMASIVSDGGYSLTLLGDELRLRRGLLDRREVVLPLARVQAVRVTASPLRRLLGRVSLRLQSGATAHDRDEQGVVVPIMRTTELGRVLALVLPGAGSLPTLERPPPAALRRALVRWTVAPAAAAVALAVLARPWGVLALAAVPLSAGLGVAAYRGLGSAMTDGLLVTRTGALVRRTVVVPGARAQSTRALASPFQRRAGLATLAVDIAGPGSSPRVVDQAAATVERLGRQVMVRAVGR